MFIEMSFDPPFSPVGATCEQGCGFGKGQIFTNRRFTAMSVCCVFRRIRSQHKLVEESELSNICTAIGNLDDSLNPDYGIMTI
jgi:hypothetical protein